MLEALGVLRGCQGQSYSPRAPGALLQRVEVAMAGATHISSVIAVLEGFFKGTAAERVRVRVRAHARAFCPARERVRTCYSPPAASERHLTCESFQVSLEARGFSVNFSQ